MLDILIRDALVIDGSGRPGYRADVGVERDRIAAIGSLEVAEAERAIDASGYVVTPGFVDMHSHADFTLPILPTADSLVQQGITSAVVGQCGSSPAPLLDETREQVIEAGQSEDRPLPWDAWSGFGSYLETLMRTGISLNVVPLVGQGTIRAGVMEFAAGPADVEQTRRMQAEVIKAMEEGAVGLSTGLIYPPGSYASTEELIALTKAVGECNGFYFSHIRNEGSELLEAIAEAIHIGRETGAAVQISHFKAVGRENWDNSDRALGLIDEAQDEGLDVTADMYPYLATSTGLKSTLPEWAHEGGKDAILQRLADDSARRKMVSQMQTTGYGPQEWETVMISHSPRNRAYEGRHVSALAAEESQSPYEWVFDALLEAETDMSMIHFAISEENRERELRHPAMMIGTDGSGLAPEGPLGRGKPHPRNYGTFPRVLGHLVRERGLISLEEAVHKMTGLPAKKLRWTERGRVQKGYAADLVVFDPAGVIDQATYNDPHRYPRGIIAVMVNGTLVVDGGTHTGARGGRVL